MRLGIDIGSTTIKAVLLDGSDNILFSVYERHMSRIGEMTGKILSDITQKYPRIDKLPVAVTGSAGIGIASFADIPFVQEVYADSLACGKYVPGADSVVELGGEDAKILFLSGMPDARMNGSCAGGTGAFIDQMAALLKMTPAELNDAAAESKKVYAIASRCGVFAKSDVQPLINQGASKEDVAASIFYSVVNQTVAGLAQGRKIGGTVVYLGGPLTFLPSLKDAFDDVLKVKGILPENSLYYAAIGAALFSEDEVDLQRIIARLKEENTSGYEGADSLFASQEEYEEFSLRHGRAKAPARPNPYYASRAHLGIDSGSTTVKTVLLDDEGFILDTTYQPNDGNPVGMSIDILKNYREKYPHMEFSSVTTTGYGEALIREAIRADYSLVETMAHYRAAKSFDKDCDFVIDIGGQDMKCFKIEDGTISDIFLNEACSSGCGSFLQTFCEALGMSSEAFSRMAIFAPKPVMLGSRCTVFMNSSVKQAQRDGASLGDISAGLAMSVVKNALYKVIRTANPAQLGKHILVQGGTFNSDAVLRAFEKELDTQVTRPDIAGLMGAYGAALYGFSNRKKNPGTMDRAVSTVLSREDIDAFTHTASTVNCGLCGNSCLLTVNKFGGQRTYISGNRCEKPVTRKMDGDENNLVAYKLARLTQLASDTNPNGKRGRIGMPLVLNFFETLPFWHAFFKSLDFSITVSSPSSRKTFFDGQADVLSDTACYPAKLVHGHIRELAGGDDLDMIFYPCMTYNIDEDQGMNHFNCPVVAYYPESAAVSYTASKPVFFAPYIGIHRPRELAWKLRDFLGMHFPSIPLREVKKALRDAFAAYESWLKDVRDKGQEILSRARGEGRHIIVLAGRPYHLDGEVNHGIDKLIIAQGAAVLTEDSLSHLAQSGELSVLNQWTYHARLYAAAQYVSLQSDMDFVQLVSFGCGLDAITTDEVKDILQDAGKLYTQLKIDEIVNLGAVSIRIRSLFAALEEAKKPEDKKKGGDAA